MPLSQFGVKLDLNELKQMNRREIEDYTVELLMNSIGGGLAAFASG